MKQIYYKIFFLFIISLKFIISQQVGDPDYNPVILNPAYEQGEGSVVYIDEAHNNFHTMEERYKPFADLLIKDGYVVKPQLDTIGRHTLDDADIFVISNALNIKNTEEWALPTPSAFTDEEINNIAKWVDEGGSLFLIADHMPFPGAAGKLAEMFGFILNNGFAFDTTAQNNPALFTRKDGTLKDNFITNGLDDEDYVDSIYSFTGEAFEIPGDATPVLVLNNNFIAFMPDTAWSFNDETKKISVAGWSQGAVENFGNGKVAMWGEAAMFSAQVAGQNKTKFGMNAPYAKYNSQLLLNIIHWLDNLDE